MSIFALLSARHQFYIKYPKLGAKELELLEHIAIAEKWHTALKVTETMKIEAVASHATTYRYINNLVSAGLIEHRHHKSKKAKHLHLTAAGKRYFDKLQTVMESSV